MRAKLKDDDKKMLLTAEQNAALSAQVSSLTEELQILSNFQKEEAQLTQIQARQHEKTAETLQSTVASLTNQRQELSNRIDELERSAGEVDTLQAQLEDLRRSESQLADELASQRAQYEQLEENLQHELLGLQKKLLVQEQEAHKKEHALQLRISAAESDLQEAQILAQAQAARVAITSGPSSATTAACADKDKDAADREREKERRHREEVEKLKETIQDLREDLEDSQAEVDTLSSVRHPNHLSVKSTHEIDSAVFSLIYLLVFHFTATL